MTCLVYLCIYLLGLNVSAQSWQTARALLSAPRNVTLPLETAHVHWTDSTCPSFLVEGNLLVTGNLFVKGRIQVLSSVDLSTFEEITQENVTRQRLSKFAYERCRKGTGSDVMRIEGDLILSQGSLIVGSGELTVLGSIASSGLLADGGGEIVANLRPLLELAAAQAPSQRRARQRSSKRDNGSLFLDVDDVVHDALCVSLARSLTEKKSSEAVIISRGLLYLKNSARLWTFGTVVSTVIGLDRSSSWLARCASILAVDDAGGAGDVALLASSALTMTGEMASLKAGQLVVSESSTVIIPADLEVEHVVKVSRTSELTISGGLSAAVVAVSDLAVASVGSRGMRVSDVVILIEGGKLLVQGDAELTSMAAYDKSIFEFNAKVNVQQNVVIDTASILTVSDKMDISGSLVLANSSSARTLSIKVGQDVNLLQSKLHVESGVSIGCTLWMQVGSELESGKSSIDIRPSIVSVDCNAASPVFHVTHSRLHGGRMNVGALGDVAPSVLLAEGSALEFDEIRIVPRRQHDATALVLSKGSTLTINNDISGFQLCILEEGSQLQANTLTAHRVTMSDQSVLNLRNLIIAWMQASSKSRVYVADKCSVDMGLEVESQSLFESRGPTLFGVEFDHSVATAGGKIVIGREKEKCPLESLAVRGSWVSQDGSEVSVWQSVEQPLEETWTVMVESRSSVVFNCPIRGHTNKTAFKKTRESIITFDDDYGLTTDEGTPRVSIYKVAVPPSDAATLQAFLRSVPMQSTGHRKEELWQLLSMFQQHVDMNAERIMSGMSATSTVPPITSQALPPIRAARSARNIFRRSSQSLKQTLDH